MSTQHVPHSMGIRTKQEQMMVRVKQTANGETIEVDADELVWVAAAMGGSRADGGARGNPWAKFAGQISAREIAEEGLDTRPYGTSPEGMRGEPRLFSRDGETLWEVEIPEVSGNANR